MTSATARSSSTASVAFRFVCASPVVYALCEAESRRRCEAPGEACQPRAPVDCGVVVEAEVVRILIELHGARNQQGLQLMPRGRIDHELGFRIGEPKGDRVSVIDALVPLKPARARNRSRSPLRMAISTCAPMRRPVCCG